MEQENGKPAAPIQLSQSQHDIATQKGVSPEMQKNIKAIVEQFSTTEFWKFLNGSVFKDLITHYFSSVVHERKNALITYLLDIILVAVLLGGVLLLAFYKILDGVTVGTLVGAIIGYALGRFKQD